MKDTRIQLFSSDQLTEAKKKYWYWKETWTQIAKDFDFEESEFEFESKEDFLNQLTSFLEPIVLYLLDNRVEYFFNLLYKIDIPEAKVKSLLPLDKNDQTLTKLVKLIVEREFLKVLIKDYIKNQKLRLGD